MHSFLWIFLKNNFIVSTLVIQSEGQGCVLLGLNWGRTNAGTGAQSRTLSWTVDYKHGLVQVDSAF